MFTARRAAIYAAAACASLTVPAVASAHDAVVTCNPTGGYQVTPDYRHLNPTWTFTPTTMVVTWTDGFSVVRPLPGSCVSPGPTPAPEPTPGEVTPTPTPAPPITCADLLTRYPGAGSVRRAAWGCPSEPTKKPTVHPRPRPRVVTCSFVVGHYRGVARARMLVRHRLPASCGRPYTPPVAG